MGTIMGLSACLLVLAISAFLFWNASRDAERAEFHDDERWLPDELRDAALLYSEPPAMRIQRPLPVVAKVDRAYRHPNGELSVLEFKTRRRHVVYDSDVIELSQQRLVLERSGRGNVRPVGFVVTELRGSNERKSHRVKLLTADAAADIASRYVGIVAGTIAPRKTDNERLCGQCAFVKECRPGLRL